MNPDKKYLITGGAGYLGVALIERLVHKGFKNLVALSRNEEKLVLLKEKFPFVEILTGDVADPFVCDRALKGVSGIFHLAGLKHVRFAEENVREAINTNIPLALLESVRKYKPEFILGISTDKAASRKGVYGTTKFLMERLFAEYEKICPTKFRIVRYGNVWASTGSIVTKWRPKLEKGEEVILTDPSATRFFWTVDQAVDLIFECLENSVDSKPLIPEMKGATMSIVLEACMEIYGKSPVKIIGLQPGENLHETMDGENFSNECKQFTKQEFIDTFLT